MSEYGHDGQLGADHGGDVGDPQASVGGDLERAGVRQDGAETHGATVPGAAEEGAGVVDKGAFMEVILRFGTRAGVKG